MRTPALNDYQHTLLPNLTPKKQWIIDLQEISIYRWAISTSDIVDTFLYILSVLHMLKLVFHIFYKHVLRSPAFWQNITRGVPQVSVIGPFLSILHVNAYKFSILPLVPMLCNIPYLRFCISTSMFNFKSRINSK